mmetsp:Transcript_31628/g.72413  ORF Transcript_31628/g.72413 Transcript_31628/m.72413 type:complete len:93 (+) Transcript_31628:597-875(+)
MTRGTEGGVLSTEIHRLGARVFYGKARERHEQAQNYGETFTERRGRAMHDDIRQQEGKDAKEADLLFQKIWLIGRRRETHQDEGRVGERKTD